MYLKSLFKKKNIKKTHHYFPLKDSHLRNRDLIEGIKVILSKNMTMSKVTKKFEKVFSQKLKMSYSLMVNSGSSANLLALQCLINPHRKKRLKKGDEVLIPSVCWPTTLWPIIQSGLKPVFVDVERQTFNISLKDLEKKISKRTKVLMLVHVLGISTDMEKLMKILNKHKIILIEDTCESIGAKHNHKFLGTFGSFSTFSFYYSHQITSIEGGMICCKNKEDENIIKSLRCHGWSRDLSDKKKIERKHKNINSKFLFVNSGYNFRPTDIQAAIGLSQFRSLDNFNKIISLNRKKIISRLISDRRWVEQVSFIGNSNKIKPSWFGLSMLFNKRYKYNKDLILNRLDKFGIENRPIIGGNFLKQPALKKYNLKQKSNNFPNANYIHDYGLFVGLRNRILNKKEINKFANIFFKSFNIKK